MTHAPYSRLARIPALSLVLVLATATPWGAVAETAPAGGSAKETLPKEVPLDSKEVRYIGRFTEDRTFQWGVTQLAFGFEGESAEVEFKDSGGKNYVRIDIDGQMTQTVQLAKGKKTIRVADKLPKGKHMVQITRRTEALFGETQLTAIRLDAGAKLIPHNIPERAYLAIGDSITCGYGNGAENENVKFSAETEMGDTTYAALAARMFGADYHCIAWSGRGIYRNRGKNDVPEKDTMPAIFERILPSKADSPTFDPKAIDPDVISINLNTNDFALGAPPKEEFVAVYVKFIKRLHEWWPNARIICINGPMMGEGKASEYIQAVVEAAGSDKVSYLSLKRNREAEGLGGDWHPSQKTHDANAKVLAEQIAKVTGWPYKATD